jgi:two-component system, chemotaxis family, chemotaxis protein CheY
MNSKRVLVIDDSSVIRKALSRVFTGAGIDVSEAADGVEALKILGTETVELIMCDLNMPNMSGMELLQESVTIRKSKSIPVVMLTTEGRPEYVEQARKLGANGWLVKPFQNDQILLLIKRFLGQNG